ncbi:XrtA/PEP-CTERM system TPR-repeat protein PrsT [Paucibacter sp. JuS9]|uniref:XrtA/PEP-CTERM system TPR-repeat protein PrsT n=1 Tax=Paucibacter sp. JuS9 TaxID=3228748 RepID=UPI0037576FE0
MTPARARFVVLSSALLLAGCFGDSAEALIEKAKEAVNKRDSRAATIYLKNALEKDSQNAEARFMLGRALVDIGDFRGALIELRKASELGFDPQEVVPLLAYSLLVTGDAKRVVADYAEFKPSTAAATAALKATLASAHLFLGNSEAALAAADQALAAGPNYPQAYLVKVKVFAASRRYDEALDLLNRVLLINQKLPEAYLLRGDILKSQNGDVQAIEKAYQDALTANARYVPAHVALIGLALSRKDMKAAQARLVPLLAAAPKHPDAIFIAAVVAFENGDLKTAQEKTQQILKLAPSNPRALQLMGVIDLKRGSLVQAETSLAKAAATLSDDDHVRLLLARAQIRAGSFDKALRGLRPMIERAVPSGDAISITAEALLLSGQVEAAQEYFARAAKLDPKDNRSRTVLALAETVGDRPEQAISLLQSIAAGDEGTFPDLALINLLMSQKKYPQALDAIGKLQAKRPNDAVAPNLRGNLELARGNRALARTSYEAALTLDSTYYPALSAISKLEVADGRVDAAKARLEGYVAKVPDNVQAQLFLISLRERDNADANAVIDSLRQLIRRFPGEVGPRIVLTKLQLMRRDQSGALGTAQEAVAAIGFTVETSDNLGQIQMAAGDVNLAIDTYAKLAKSLPNSSVPHMRQAEIYITQKNAPAAIQSLRRAIAISPDSAPALQMLVVLEMNAGQAKEALAVARSAQQKFKSSPFGHMLEGDLWASQKNWDAAAGAYRRGLDLVAAPELAVRLHRVLLRLPASARADEFQRQWLAQHSADPVFRMYLAGEAVKRSDFGLASSYYENVVKGNPQNIEALNNLAWTLARAGKPGALDVIRQAIKLAPQDGDLHDTMADIYASSNDWPKAVEAQKVALSLRPNWHEARLRLAKLYLRQGSKLQARQELETLQRLGEKHPLYKEVRAMLAAS